MIQYRRNKCHTTSPMMHSVQIVGTTNATRLKQALPDYITELYGLFVTSCCGLCWAPGQEKVKLFSPFPTPSPVAHFFILQIQSNNLSNNMLAPFQFPASVSCIGAKVSLANGTGMVFEANCHVC